MAYFYQHIKGLTSSGTAWKINCETFDDSSSTAMKTPSIIYGAGNTSLGQIVTTNMPNGVMSASLAFNGGLIMNSSFNATNTSYNHYIYSIKISDVTSSYEGSINIARDSSNNKVGIEIANNTGKSVIIKATGTSGDNKMTFSGNQIKAEAVSQIGFRTRKTGTSANLYDNPISFAICDGFGSASTYKGFYLHTPTNLNDTEAVFNVPINATYFNATSDKRAKTNINQSTFSALNIIKSLPIYNFKYKSDNTDSIGIIAQDALKVNAGNFNLVVNPQASGENGNYMSVKESKLVYIAWKAIQEQQEIIDKQSKEIEELKQLVKTLIEK